MNYHDPGIARNLSAASGAPHKDEVCTALCGILRQGVDVHRCLAAQALGRIGHPGAVETLVGALLDEDEDVRTDAARALSRLADPRAGTQLLENLVGDPCGDVKLAAIEGLVRLRCAEVIPWLRRMLKGRDAEIAWDDDSFYDGGWDDWLDVQVKAVQALADMGAGEAVPEIVAVIDDERGQDMTETAFKALARLGKPGVDALIRFLDDKNERRRRRAAAVLAGVSGEAAEDAVARALRDPSMGVRLAAARPLAARNPTDARLVPLFRDDQPEVRAEAVRLCGRHHPSSVDALLDDEADRVVQAVLGVLAEAPDLLPADAVVERLRACLRGSAADTAAAAAVALAAVAPEASLDDLVEHLGDAARPPGVRMGALRGLAAVGGGQAARALVGVLGDDDRQIRLEAMVALAGMAESEREWPNFPGAALLAALRGELVPEPADVAKGRREDRPAAAQTTPGEDGGGEGPREPAFPTSTLQSILNGESPAAEILEKRDEGVELTQDDMERLALARRFPRKKRLPVAPRVAPHQDVRRFAARVLGDVAGDDVALELARALKDDDTDVRLAAADSLARIGGRMTAFPRQAAEALVGALADPARDMRLSAIRALGAAGGEGIADRLFGLLADEDSFIRTEAIGALSRLGKAGPGIEALLADREPGVRLAAAGAVAGAGGARAVGPLVDFAFAFDGYHRREAGRLLRNVDVPAANARFLDVLDDADRLRTWQVAIEALEELNRPDPPADGSAGDQDEPRD
ncbi:MAG: HEAT repeat domain-containing protein [Rhodospirillales bacterium]